MILESAYKHGLTKADICHAYRAEPVTTRFDGDEIHITAPGYAGQLIELGIRAADDIPDTLVIFHAQLARPKNLPAEKPSRTKKPHHNKKKR